MRFTFEILTLFTLKTFFSTKNLETKNRNKLNLFSLFPSLKKKKTTTKSRNFYYDSDREFGGIYELEMDQRLSESDELSVEIDDRLYFTRYPSIKMNLQSKKALETLIFQSSFVIKFSLEIKFFAFLSLG